jgi:hypothetical protein
MVPATGVEAGMPNSLTGQAVERTRCVNSAVCLVCGLIRPAQPGSCDRLAEHAHGGAQSIRSRIRNNILVEA